MSEVFFEFGTLYEELKLKQEDEDDSINGKSRE